MKLAVIETGGKQYLVSEGQKIKVEKISADKNGAVVFDKVLLVFDGKKTVLGKPLIKGASVEAKLTKTGRNRKVIVFRYHSKTRYRKKKGHRQYFTEVAISKI